MVNFFIDRPIFAWVVAIVMMLAGLLAIKTLPISQYPPVAPPSISVDAFYPGASAKTVENTVTQIIEQKMTGLDRLLYMSATSDSAGHGSVTLTFQPGTDPDAAWAKVQNKLELAKPLMPQVVQQMGITVTKSTKNIFMILSITSTDGSMNAEDLRDYLASNVENVISRVQGVGEVMSFGTQYAMRIWLNPDKMVGYGITPDDIRQSVKAYNAQVSAGQAGGLPAVKGQKLNVTVNVQELLQTPEQFGAVPLRINPDGSTIRLRDVARTELGTESYESDTRLNGKPAAGMLIRLASGANALDTSKLIKAKVGDLAPYFPPSVEASYPYETTPFVTVAINEVVKTLVEAVILVFLVMLLFLGNFRATLIPTIAVPVVLLGTFAILQYVGMSINMLTMFAMVLAIGLLVDDAIVVVENVERIMHDEGLPPLEATRKSMGQITGALVGIGLVLSAVFGPMAFFGGSTGVIFQQFSFTLITAMMLSVVVALILTPSLCVTFLKPIEKGHEAAEKGWKVTRPLFLWFDRFYHKLNGIFVSQLDRVLAKWVRYTVIYGVIVVGLGVLFMRLPTAFLPEEDQGILMTMVQLPAGSTMEQTQKVMDEVRQHFQEQEKDAVASCMTVSGFSIAGRGQNNGMAFIKLKDWHLRDGKNLKADAVVGRAMKAFSSRRDAMVFAFAPPAILELGNATGFDFQLQDRAGVGHAKLMEARNQLLGMTAQNANLKAVRPNGLDDQPEYNVRVNQDRAGALGVPLPVVSDTLASAWGGSYINDFINQGRVKRVYMQADAPFRMQLEDLNKLYVRNKTGTMVPFSAFSTGEWSYGSPNLQRYNSFPSMNIQGEPAAGKSTGDAMLAMEDLASKLPAGIGYEWTGLSYQERQAGSQAPALYAVSILVVFLCLAALYESWSVPFSVLIVLPIGVFGAVLATWSRGLSSDVYFQIGLLTTMGLTAKNAILIVQFAEEQMAQGAGLVAAALEAAKLRLRPIMMTSLAFTFGVLPMALTRGAGAAAQNAIGTSVVGGMLSATFIAVFFIPLSYVLVNRFFTGPGREAAPAGPAVSEAVSEEGKL
ncbi:efflux RND transporter permease subunit [Geothrix fermentans]|uniref:efflux RND transporter permease subunit n=1 Tax=Geothrix fermentans TaxID=44676 RepID=UPI000408DBDC|nr:efflux RND transporter permease subunit [Geothrix fermentans]